MISDYHLHSEFSDDSTEFMESYIPKCKELNIDEICFTDHVDYGIKNDWDEEIIYRGSYDDPFNRVILANVNYPEYFSKIDRLNKMYGDIVKIKAGLEFGIQTHTIDKYKKLVEKYGDKLDFILLSIHQVGDKEFWTGEFIDGKSQDEYNLAYYQELLDVIKVFDDYDVLAHVDLISRYDKLGVYPFEKIKPILTEIFKIVISKGKGIEINTSSWKYGLSDTTPSKDILKLYYDLGGEIITIGSDGHKVEHLLDHYYQGKEVLKDIGFKHFYTFDKRKPIRHDL